MTRLIFPDTTVLVNFAIINRMDLLREVANGHGAWCLTVASETNRSSTRTGLEALRDCGAIFGSPLAPTQAEHLDTQLLRVELAKPGDGRLDHLGEAETLAIMISRGYAGFFVTDDGDARRLAEKNAIDCLSTWDILRLAVIKSFVDVDAAWGYVQTLDSNDRGHPPGVQDRSTFDSWHGFEADPPSSKLDAS